MTVSEPSGAFAAVQDPEPVESVTVHSGVDPTAKATVPLGVPVEPVVASATSTEKVVLSPKTVDAGLTVKVVELAARATLSEAIPEDPP